MKKIIFLAHDPGGLDCILPVFEQLTTQNSNILLFCVGPAATLATKYAQDKGVVTAYIQEQIQQNTIACLVTGTSWGDTFELEVIELCKSEHIPTISILDYWSNYSYRFKSDDKYIYPDYFIVMDELASKEAIADGVPAEIIKVLGHPGLDKFIKQKSLPHTNHTPSTALVISQPLSLLYGDTLGFTEVDFINDCVEILSTQNIPFKIKFHPKDTTQIQAQYQQYAETQSLTDCLSNYDIVIGMNSMALLHAYLSGKIVISYQPNLQVADCCITNKLNITTPVTDKNIFSSQLNHISLINKTSKSSYLPFLDGNSTGRIVSFILDLSL